MDLSISKGRVMMTMVDFIARCNKSGVYFSETATAKLLEFEQKGYNPLQALREVIVSSYE